MKFLSDHYIRYTVTLTACIQDITIIVNFTFFLICVYKFLYFYVCMYNNHAQRQWIIIGSTEKLVKPSNKTHDPKFWSILESRHIHSKSRSVVVITIITISKAILTPQEIVYMILALGTNRPFLHIIVIIIHIIFLFCRANANLCTCFSLKPIGVCFYITDQLCDILKVSFSNPFASYRWWFHHFSQH